MVSIVHQPEFWTTLADEIQTTMIHSVRPSAPTWLVLSLVFALVSCGTPAPTGTANVQGSAEQEDVLRHADWTKNATIYEVNLRQHTPEGTIEAFIPDLPRLKELGVDILWLMPIHPIGEVNR